MILLSKNAPTSSDLPHCPQQLPVDLTSSVKGLAECWAKSEIRPHPPSDTIQYWGSFIQEWINAPDLPLLIRKHRNDRGSIIAHTSGRSLIPVDNSPAHWSFANALSSELFCLDDIRLAFQQDKIPVAMAFKKDEKAKAKFKCIRSRNVSLNNMGWKLAHIEPVRLGVRGSIDDAPLNLLVEHFKRLMSPSNMFVVPLVWAGFGELPEVREVMKSFVPEKDY